jgi:anti-anti-sigma factor
LFLSLASSLDVPGSRRLPVRAASSAAPEQPAIDLKHLVYISSAGFRALLVAGQLAEETKGTLALCSLSSEVQRLFDLGAFTDLFVIYGSREEGLTKLS